MNTNNILYIDSQELSRFQFKRFSRRHNLYLDTAKNIEEALHFLAKPSANYAIVIIDTSSFEIDGEEMVEHLRKILPESILIIIDENFDRYSEFVANSLFSQVCKPWSPKELLQIIKFSFDCYNQRLDKIEEGENHHPSNSKTNILLIEENRVVTNSVIEMLTASGSNQEKNITHVSSIEDALAVIKQQDFHLIITNLDLPDSSGLVTLTSIIAKTAIPIIVLSSHVDEHLAKKAINIGAQDYLVYGRFDQEKLRDTVDFSIERYVSQLQFHKLLDELPDTLLVIDQRGEILFANKAASHLFESTIDELVGSIIGYPISSSHSIELQLPSGIFIEMFVDEIDWQDIFAFRVCCRDITARKVLENKYQYLALHDPLTQLGNRLLLNTRVEYAIKEYQRSNIGFGFLMLDLDRFKLINDSVGHHSGDLLLMQAANRLRQLVRDSDIVARVGGDEFVIVVTGIHNNSATIVLAKKILSAMEQPFIINGKPFTITASIGIVLYPDNGEDYHELLKNADSAMYRAKRAGRNDYCFFDKSVNELILKKLQLESELALAIEEEQFELYYQSQTANNKIIGFEALIRWNHPSKGQLSPDEFIPLLEQTGMLRQLESTILRQAVSQISTWRTEFDATWRIAINIAAPTFEDSSFANEVLTVLEEHHLPTNCLELEVTESLLFSNEKKALTILTSLRDIGIHIALDDFGTGYSSLGYLMKFNFFSTLKIDKDFVEEMQSSKKNYAIVKTIVELGHSLDMTIVAEGVETQEQKKDLEWLNCDVLQGYYFSKPASVPYWNEQFRAL